MATTKLTAPWNEGYLDGFRQRRVSDQRLCWDEDQRRAYLDGYQEGTGYYAECERAAKVRAAEGGRAGQEPPAAKAAKVPIERMETVDLLVVLAEAEDAGDDETVERAEAELDRRDRDADDPAVIGAQQAAQDLACGDGIGVPTYTA